MKLEDAEEIIENVIEFEDIEQHTVRTNFGENGEVKSIELIIPFEIDEE